LNTKGVCLPKFENKKVLQFHENCVKISIRVNCVKSSKKGELSEFVLRIIAQVVIELLELFSTCNPNDCPFRIATKKGGKTNK